MEIVYRNGSVSASDVQKDLPDTPSYSTVRTLLRILEEKGQLKHKVEGQKYIYYPTVPKVKAIKNAFESILETFFNNSVEHAVSALLDINKSKISKQELDILSDLIEKAREEGEKNE
jgi:predicted transcriptional regulator